MLRETGTGVAYTLGGGVSSSRSIFGGEQQVDRDSPQQEDLIKRLISLSRACALALRSTWCPERQKKRSLTIKQGNFYAISPSDELLSASRELPFALRRSREALLAIPSRC